MTGSLGFATLVVVLLGAVPLVAVTLRRRSLERRRLRFADRRGRIPIPLRPVTALDPVFLPGPLGPDRNTTEVVFLGGGAILVPGSTSDYEAWILAVLSRRARRMFEFGTCTGRTAYMWARNSPADAVVTTLTLGPQQHDRYSLTGDDRAIDQRLALDESAFDSFLYQGTDVEHKIEQLATDSKEFDERPYLGLMDLIFIDGSHAYSYVMSDSRKALRMIKPGGLILWHDYEGPLAGRGTDLALAELSRELELSHIDQTRMVWYRAPRTQAAAGEPSTGDSDR